MKETIFEILIFLGCVIIVIGAFIGVISLAQYILDKIGPWAGIVFIAGIIIALVYVLALLVKKNSL